MKAWVFILSLALAGCSSAGKLLRLSKATPPALTVTNTATGSTVTQTGDAQQPARVSTVETQASVPVPSGSVITITPPQVSEHGEPSLPIVLTSKATTIQGPAAFSPPAPPTPQQLANADATRQSYYFAGALLLGAGFLFWRGHVKAAVVALACGVAAPILANFAGSEIALRVCIAGVCIAGALFAGWHFMNDRREAKPLPQNG